MNKKRREKRKEKEEKKPLSHITLPLLLLSLVLHLYHGVFLVTMTSLVQRRRGVQDSQVYTMRCGAAPHAEWPMV